MVWPIIHSQSNILDNKVEVLNNPLPIFEEKDHKEEEEVTSDIAKLQLQLARIKLELSNLQYKHNSETQNLELDFLDDILTLSPIRQSIIPFEDDMKDKKSPIIQPFYSNAHNFDRFFAKINKVFLLVS